MRIFMVIILFFASASSSFASSSSVEVQVPENATILKFTAKKLILESCADNYLEIVAGFGAATNQFSVNVVSENFTCTLPNPVEMDLKSDIKIDKQFGQPDTLTLLFDNEQISDVKITFE